MEKIFGVRVRYFAYHTPGTVPNMAKITKKMRKKCPRTGIFNWEQMCDKY